MNELITKTISYGTSPRPWAICGEPPNDAWVKDHTIYSVSEGKRVGDTTRLDFRGPENAALIVQAVNSHDYLVAALKQAAMELQEAANIMRRGLPSVADILDQAAQVAFKKSELEAEQAKDQS